MIRALEIAVVLDAIFIVLFLLGALNLADRRERAERGRQL